jgi:outer membrane lipoprotein SlyB
MRPGLAHAFAIALAVAFSAALAQTIRIPDFRQAPPATFTIRGGEACTDCGRILSIREIQIERRPQVPQALQNSTPGPTVGPGQNNMVGAVIYLPLGNNPGERPFVGGVGTPEMRERFQETTYEISVRLDDGALRFLQRHDGTRYRVGDKVRLPGAGQIELLAD